MNWNAWSLEQDIEGSHVGHLLLTVEADDDAPRAPVAANILLDRSGSMKGAPLAAAIEAVQQLIEQAGPDDVLGLLTFDGLAEQRVPLIQMDSRGKHEMAQALREIQPGRGTALYQAIETGTKAATRVLVPGRRPALFVLTDGEPSVGPESELAFRQLGARVVEMGARVFGLGLGAHYLPEIMDALTRPSGNGYGHVDGPEGLTEALGAVFSLLFGEVATDLTVRITPHGFRSFTCHHAYPARPDGDSLIVTLGSLSRGIRRQALFSGPVSEPIWSTVIAGSATERGDKRQQSVIVSRVWADNEEGRLIRALRVELELVAAETNGWLSLAKRERERAAKLMEQAEASLRLLVSLAVPEIPVRRHLERLGDLRLAVERGEGDLPLLMRRAKAARAGTHVSQIIQMDQYRAKK